MSLPKIMPLTDPVALIEVHSLILEEEPVTVAPILPSAVLPNRIAVVGNYLPRRCGIATFTTDLCDAIHAEFGATELLALPVNDTEEGYTYPARVRFALSQDNLDSYRHAADFLNFSRSTGFACNTNMASLADALADISSNCCGAWKCLLPRRYTPYFAIQIPTNAQ